MRIVVALGGNALQAENMPATAENQLKVLEQTIDKLIVLVEQGHEIIITHGNGPQVGRIILQNETAKKLTPAMPFDVCGAMSQGMIGYHIQQTMKNALSDLYPDKAVVTLLTQVVVDKSDKGFQNPTKPIGSFYTKEEADQLIEKNGYIMKEDSGRGYRRLVASPVPKRIVELDVIKRLVKHGDIVITVGGGGIPVIETEQGLIGVEAVIDKDLASQRLAEDLSADILIMLTAVDNAAINFGKENQKNLHVVSVDELKKYKDEGHFASGSMLPKVEAGINFVASAKNRKAIITSLDKVEEALSGVAGTIIE